MKNLPRAIPRVAVATALVGGLVVALTPVSSATEVTVASNPTFATSTQSWQVSSNAKLGRRTYANGDTFGLIRRKSSKGKATIWMRTHATDPLPRGTTIRMAGRVSPRERGRKVRFELREFNPAGDRIQRFAGNSQSRSRAWRWTGAHLTTQGKNSTVRLFVKQPQTRGTKALRIRDIQEVITLPTPEVEETPDVEDEETPDPEDEGGGGGVPVESDSVTCEDIDYSDPAQGVQTFGDEFDGDEVDTNRWRVRDKTSLSFDNGWITKDNVTVHDGQLDIAGFRMDEPVTGKPGPDPERWYSTGYIDTMDSAQWGNPGVDRFSQKYGYFEMRAKLPTSNSMAQGIWPAFWLRGNGVSGEIDIMEAYGAPTTRSYDPSSTYEWNTFKVTGNHAQGTTWGRADIGDIKAYEDFHTYAVNWSPTCLRFLFDGETMGTVMIEDVPYLAGPAFDAPFNIRLNMQVGSYWGWPGPDVTADEFHYLVDYVRVYQALPAEEE